LGGAGHVSFLSYIDLYSVNYSELLEVNHYIILSSEKDRVGNFMRERILKLILSFISRRFDVICGLQNRKNVA